MKYFPIFLHVGDQRVLVAGGGETAIAKLRLLMKTEARIEVYSTEIEAQIIQWADSGELTIFERQLKIEDTKGARAIYAADESKVVNQKVVEIAKTSGVLLNIVDVLEGSEFITPAIVDRDPLTIAIGTEGAAPMLARKIKAQIEEMVPQNTGMLARIGQGFRTAAEALPFGRPRRKFWASYYEQEHIQDESEAKAFLNDALTQDVHHEEGRVSFVGAGPGDPELLTMKARKRLHEADVIIYDRLVSSEILELARREAQLIEVGKTGYGLSWKQEDINALLVKHAQNGDHVVRLKSGDPSVYGRLDEELNAMRSESIDFDVVPGVTSALAAAASLGQSLTRRGRNSELRFLTGRDVEGFADHDWKALAANGQTAAIYMGAKASIFLRGRLLMHGADGATPITAMANVSRINEQVIASNLANLPEDLEREKCDGPIVLLFGIAPHQAQHINYKEAANGA